jgi:hypothetical protein
LQKVAERERPTRTTEDVAKSLSVESLVDVPISAYIRVVWVPDSVAIQRSIGLGEERR